MDVDEAVQIDNSIINKYNELVKQQRVALISVSSLIFVGSLLLIIMYQYANMMLFYAQVRTLEYTVLSLILLTCYPIMLILGDIVVLSSMRRCTLSDGRLPGRCTSCQVIKRVMQANFRILLAPLICMLAYLCLFLIKNDTLFNIINYLYFPLVVICLLPLSKDHLFTTIAAVSNDGKLRSYRDYVMFGEYHREQISCAVSHTVYKLRHKESIVPISIGVFILLLYFVWKLFLCCVPGDDPAVLFTFLLSLPPYPSLAFVVVASIVIARNIFLPYNTILRWLLYTEFMKVKIEK